MRFSRGVVLGTMSLVLLSACSTGGAGSRPAMKIGSDGFDEARVVAEVYAQVLEVNGYSVDRAGIGLGTREVTNAALFSGQLDMKPEYLGGGLAKLAPGTQTNDPAKNQELLQAALATQGGGITVLDYTPGQDTNTLVTRKETADANKLAKWSDLTAVADKLKWGLATNCATNPVCGEALKTAYGIDITKIDVTLLDACSTPMAEALKSRTIDVAELCSTDPLIITEGWVRLEDDKQTQPAENIAPIVRDDYLAKVDKAAFKKLLDDVSARIDTATLAQLYKEVAVDKKDTKDVASAWLKAQGLIK